MPDVVSDVSPLQYLHQVGLLDLLPALYEHITVPQAVLDEIRAGTAQSVDLPLVESLDWIKVGRPRARVVLPLAVDLGPGEREVLAIALEAPGSLVILDDAMARRYAKVLGLKLTGTLGVLLKAKETGLLPSIAPVVERLQALRFRVDPATREAILRLAGEG